jgi:glucose-6-phosphate dehydrogenase assembly protein OpcA
MNWGRVTHWREMVAQFFDGPALRPYLDRISHVTIDFALSERLGVNRAQALLLAGWLSSRLGWQPADNVYELLRVDSGVPTARLSLQAGQRPVTITLHGEQRATDVRGDIHSVRLEVMSEGTEKVEASFTVALPDKADEHAWTCIEIEGVEATTRPMLMGPLTKVELLDNELEVFSRDKIYEESLEMVGAFIQSSVKKPDPAGPRKLVSGEPMSAGAQAPRPRPSGSDGGAPQQ